MSQKNTGGPAFPQAQCLDPNEPQKGFVSGLDVGEGGMTLRDYFAAKAMQGWFASYPDDQDTAYAVRGVCDVAAFSYDVADAMLKAREK